MTHWLLGASAMIAFAGNSLLNREALAGQHIDPSSFAFIRLASGALALVLLHLFYFKRASNREQMPDAQHGVSWWGAVALVTYMLGFSFAYVQLDAGMGALLLFSAVQFTMILFAVAVAKERFTYWQWCMLVIAFAAFTLLVNPQTTGTSVVGSLLMIVAGIAWGVYSIVGKQGDPQKSTLIHFVRGTFVLIPLACLMWFISGSVVVTHHGVVLAIISGVVTSAFGYSLWYAVVKKIATSQAAIMQLSVPPIALVLGSLLLAERLSIDAIIISTVLLGAILGFTIARQRY
ncbi:DMT family transporter [Pseudoalteromonas sp. SSDWG2]|uniref:DMT family transporter n=1 Tax=Pseudoalteromonas sp. SSDWG2 TaxID=3139391 RepID=UPI003BABD87F